MLDRILRVTLVIMVVAACSWARAQSRPVATVPWAHLGQGPDRTCCSPYAGPLNTPHISMQLLQFTDEPLTHLLLDRDGMLHAVSLDGNLYKFNASFGEDELVVLVQLPWTPTDIALGFDGTAYITLTEGGYGRLAAIKDDIVLWERQFPAQDEIHVLPTPDFSVIVLTSDGRMFCLNTDGEEKWRYTVPGIFERCTRPSVGRSGIIYFSVNGVRSRTSTFLEDSCVFAVSRDGVELWERPAPVGSLSYPVIDEEENIYVIGSDGLLYSFCSAGLNWAEPAADPLQEAYLAYFEEKIIVLSGGNVTAHCKSGQRQPLWSVSLCDPFISAPAIGSDGMTYALTRPPFQGSSPTLTAIGTDGDVKWSVPINCDTQTPPIITIEGNICIGASEGCPIYLEFGRGDITPPYMSETFPPKDTIVPIDDVNVMVVLVDKGVGIRPSSIYISVDNELVHFTMDDVIGGYRLFATPHQIVAPFQVITIEVSAEDKRFNREIQPFHLTAVEYRNRPVVVMAGFGNTDVSSSGGGRMRTIALMDPLTDIEEVELYHTPSAFSQPLEDAGQGIDIDLKGRWYSADNILPAGLVPGQYKLEIVARDTLGRTSLIWPYFTVERKYGTRFVGGADRIGRGAKTPLDLMGASISNLERIGPIYSGRTPQPLNGEAPFILAAGYTYSHMTAAGGVVRFEALVSDEDGIDDVERVDVYIDGYPIGLSLNNEGEYGDGKAGDNLFTYQVSLGGDIFATGAYLYELKAFDRAGNESNLWPYLEIKE